MAKISRKPNYQAMSQYEHYFTKSSLMNIVSLFLKESVYFTTTSWKLFDCGSDVVGFQGSYLNLVISYRQPVAREKKLSLFIKTLPQNKERAQKLIEVGYFKREHGIYTKILSIFEHFQELQTFPKCGPSLDSNLIILQDLKADDYCVRNPRVPFDRDHCIIAIESLAAFHAASFIYEERESARTGEKRRIEDTFSDVLVECGYIYEGWYVVGMEAARGLYIRHPRLYHRMIEVENIILWRKLFKNALQLCRPSETSRNVLCHRDLWANNIMFKYDDKKSPIHCMFVDFQAGICMPPAGDIVSLIYLNLKRSDRTSLFEELIDYYYERLKYELSKHKLKIENVYMRFEEFSQECQTYKLWGMVQCLLLHQLALLIPKEVQDVLDDKHYDYILNVARNNVVIKAVDRDDIYRSRMMETFEEFIETYFNQ